MAKARVARILDIAIVVVGCAMAFYHLASTQYLIHGSYEHQDFHLGFALILIFLASLRAMKRRRLWPLVLLSVSLFVTSYIKIRFLYLEEVVGLPATIDVIVGILLVIVVLEATRQAWGMVLPVVGMVSILYFFFGHYLPGPFYHLYMNPEYVISMLGIGLHGIFGMLLAVSANYIFLFMVFGGLMEIAGANLFFLQVGRAAGKVLAGGPAQTAVVSSGLVGMVTGTAVGNVAITGAFTIPLMKRIGYRPETAGAIEATASTGGQVMPPVMGASAFLIANFLGIHYAMVMVAALIPALLYYLMCALGVQVIALKEKIKPAAESVDLRILLRRAPLFIIPLAVIFTLLLMRFTPMYAAFWAILAVLAVAFLQKETRPSVGALAQGFARGAMVGARIGIALACVGLMVQALITTGLGIKISGVVETLAAGNLVIALLVTMFVSLVLGIGIPTVAAYTLVAIVVVPVLTRMGVVPIAAHFYAFYFAIISALTPPVAMAALAGASIAGANYFKTGLEAFRLGIAGFILPFFMVYNPVFLLQGGEPLSGGLSVIAAVIAMSALIAVVYNHFLVPISQWERAVYALCAASSFAYVFTGNYMLFALGIFLFVGLMVLQRRTRKASLPASDKA